MELLHRQLSRYAVFGVESEDEALRYIGEATALMYDSPPRLIGFSEEGSLVSEQLSGDDEDDPGGRGDWEEYEDETISLSRYGRGGNLLTIELFNDLDDPADPLYTDNIVLARHLEKLCQSKT